jgi:predicted DNA-binding antitoxin AbrB/MazE fold protein
MTITAVYENGVFRPLEPVDLPDKTTVEIVHLSVLEKPTEKDDYPLMRLVEIAKQFPGDPDRPADFAAQHDHYLYGTPKRP